MQSETIPVPVALLQEVVNYLAGRPFREVAPLIGKMAELAPKAELPKEEP